MDAERSSREREVAELAADQHGVVARRQLVDMGFGRGAIARRIAQGRLHRVHQGVYAVGHSRLGTRGRWVAAVLAIGPDAVLSHRSAGALWGLVTTSRSAVEVTSPRSARSRAGIEHHRAPLAADEIKVHDGVPATSVPRTLLDLSSVLTSKQMQRAIERAEALRLTDPLSPSHLLMRHPGRRGVATLRSALVATGSDCAPTRSELENRFLDFLDRHALPAPQVNVSLEVRGRWMECDCVWRGQRVIVELDGRATHDTAAAFERDRMRDRVLAADGWRVVRITWRQLHDDPERLASDLRELLGTSVSR